MQINTNVKTLDFSASVVYTSCQFSDYRNHFEIIQELFEAQKKHLSEEKIKKYIDKNKADSSIKEDSYIEDLEQLYNAQLYICLGDLDVLLLSFIEGFGMGSRILTTFKYAEAAAQINGLGNNRPYPFNTQITLGAIPEKGNEQYQENNSTLIDNINIINNGQYLITVTKVKLNDELLFLYGNKLVNSALEKIREITHEINKNFNTKSLVLLKYSWCEINIIFFCNTFSFLDAELNLKLQSLKLKDLELINSNGINQEESVENLCKPVIAKTTSILGFRYDLLQKSEEEIQSLELDDNTLIHTHTKWEVCPEKLIQAQNVLTLSAEKIKKPNHQTNIASNKENGIWISRGKGDFSTFFHKISVKDLIIFYKEILRLNSSKDYKNCLLKASTIIDLYFPNGDKLNRGLPQGYPQKYLDQWKTLLYFSAPKLTKLRLQLKNLFVPHTMIDSAVRMYTLYNNGIEDNNFFSRFIELHPVLDYLIKEVDFLNLKAELRKIKSPIDYGTRSNSVKVSIDEHIENRLDDGFPIEEIIIELNNLMLQLPEEIDDENIVYKYYVLYKDLEARQNVKDFDFDDLRSYSEELNRIIHGFHYTFLHRFLSSHATKDLYDIYLFFHGGVQGVVTGLETFYKSACKILGHDKSFLFVEGAPGFEIRKHTLRLHKSFIFMPELLASVYIPEVINQSIFKFNNYERNYEKVITYYDNNSSVSRFHLQEKSIEITFHARKLYIFNRRNERYKLNLESAIFEIDHINFFKPQHTFYKAGIIDAELLEHIQTEIMGFSLLYRDNYYLFRYWFWITHYSYPSFYLYDAKEDRYRLNKDEFRRLMIRFLIVVKGSNADKYSEITKDDNAIINIHIKTPYLDGELYKAITKDCINFVNNYFFNKQNTIFEKWCQDSKLFATKILQDGNTSESIYELLKKSVNLQNVVNSFQHGNDIQYNFPEQLQHETINFIKNSTLSYCFLASIFQTSEDTKDEKTYILTRKFITEENRLDNQSAFEFEVTDNSILGDPLGGNFVIRPETRRKILKYRNSFFQYLQDLSNKDKKHYLKHLITAEE